jgi:hypothetical protein
MTEERKKLLDAKRMEVILDRNRLQEQVDDLETTLHMIEAELDGDWPEPPEDEL